MGGQRIFRGLGERGAKHVEEVLAAGHTLLSATSVINRKIKWEVRGYLEGLVKEEQS